ncbi:PorT family protein [Neolewinella antarctica]|uniref:Outer membrane protein beta-barrel domain-containing protein n=1 Tax=Neolewinella antarctica TaxID=442734 RepID=A0ABX0XBG7_9BACT|nr:PorT family protein [Neolewinella antarctica]NJC26618.1 hypothetical protein [Neolewinella antarctica]
MKHIDDLFRDGLSGRKGDVPADLWAKIQAARPAVPAGEALDQKFSDALRDREAPVPIGMWGRIVAARALPRKRALYALASLALLLLMGGFLYLNQGQAPVTPAATAPAVAQVDPARDLQLATTERTSTSEAVGIDQGALSERPAPSANATAARNTSNNLARNAGAESSGTQTLPGAPVGMSASEAATPPPTLMNERNTAVTSPLPSIVNFLPVTTTLPKERKQKFRLQPTKGTSFSRAPRHRSQTEMLFGGAYANQVLTASTPEDRALLSARENSEFPEVSYQITLRQSYRFTDRIVLRGGLTYVDVRNQLDYEEIVDNELVFTSRNNHLRMLEVPVLAGLTIPGKRLSVSINAGPVFNLTTAVQGSYLDPDTPEPIDLRESGNYRTYTGVGYMTSLTTTYAIGKKEPFVLVLEPFFKHYPGSFTRPGARIQESYWLAGLQLGIRKGL